MRECVEKAEEGAAGAVVRRKLLATVTDYRPPDDLDSLEDLDRGLRLERERLFVFFLCHVLYRLPNHVMKP